MEFKFKVQQYQTDAVDDIVKIFEGQPPKPSYEHILDVGTFISEYKSKPKKQWNIETGELETVQESHIKFEESGEALAYCNAPIDLTPEVLLKNIQNLQRDHNIEVDSDIDMRMGAPSFDIEMETGTGKTYVYTKAMFELNKRYGWNKFIIVVPTVAIREGVQKSLEFTEEHFFRECGYEKKILSFIYSSNNFTDIDHYSQSDDINVMIINQQSFSSLEKNKYFQKQDSFGSRRPSDVVKDNHPIIIVDEPHRILGKEKKPSKTADILSKEFGALFFLHFSATHEIHHNLIYRLDALDAYNQRLVKKLQVADVHISNATGRSCYIYVSEIIPNGDKNPRAKIEIECVRKDGGPKPQMRTLDIGDSLYDASDENPLYKDVKITNINMADHYVEFDGLSEPVFVGEYVGKAGDEILRRLEIRTTIEKHLIKEEQLFNEGIKCLSLFFIDKVVKYRDYDQEDLRGEYCRMFDEEYKNVLAERLPMIGDEKYAEYLKSLDPLKIRDGYFSVDSKGRMIDSKEGKLEEGSDDESAYQRILVKKKELLTYDSKLRFIFSHSALREGWDNPNIFQICTLKHPDESNKASRRQEVGRGMRICVDKDGNRMDYDTLGESDFHKYNTLTIITEEQFRKFYDGIQSEIASSLGRRPIEITPEYFEKQFVLIDGERTQISKQQAQKIYAYLVNYDYIDGNHISDLCRKAITDGSFVKPSGPVLDPISDAVSDMIKAIAENKVYEIENGHATMVPNKTPRLDKPEFLNLWDAINHKFVYRVDFNSEDLIRLAIAEIDKRLEVPRLAYEINTVTQKDTLSREDLTNGTSYGDVVTERGTLKSVEISVKYDLVGEIASKCSITRKTVVSILEGIYESKFQMYQHNPAEFISRISNIINDVKSNEIVKHIHYEVLEGKFEIDLFKQFRPMVDASKAIPTKKNVHEYILAASEVEAHFAKQLDESDEVEVYAKLPDSRNSFYIPTPIGNYSPDWAIAFKKNGTKHLYFVAETKGDMNPNTRSPYENQKIECAKVAYGELTPDIGYDVVKNFDDLWQKLHAEE